MWVRRRRPTRRRTRAGCRTPVRRRGEARRRTSARRRRGKGCRRRAGPHTVTAGTNRTAQPDRPAPPDTTARRPDTLAQRARSGPGCATAAAGTTTPAAPCHRAEHAVRSRAVPARGARLRASRGPLIPVECSRPARILRCAACHGSSGHPGCLARHGPSGHPAGLRHPDDEVNQPCSGRRLGQLMGVLGRQQVEHLLRAAAVLRKLRLLPRQENRAPPGPLNTRHHGRHRGGRRGIHARRRGRAHAPDDLAQPVGGQRVEDDDRCVRPDAGAQLADGLVFARPGPLERQAVRGQPGRAGRGLRRPDAEGGHGRGNQQGGHAADRDNRLGQAAGPQLAPAFLDPGRRPDRGEDQPRQDHRHQPRWPRAGRG